MLGIFDGKAGELGDIYLRLCVPENFLNKDDDNFQIGSSVSSWWSEFLSFSSSFFDDSDPSETI